MKTPIIIGITGGIGGGKSTFSKHLRDRGELVFDTDLEAKKLQNQSPIIRAKLIKEFGDDIYNAEGLDRQKLSMIVFGNPEKLQKLNEIVHPEVLNHFKEWIKINADKKILFMECAILFEEGQCKSLIDKVVVVTAPVDVRIKRVMKRDNLSEEAVRARMQHQLSEEKKMELADWVYDTDNQTLSHKRVDDFLLELEKLVTE